MSVVVDPYLSRETDCSLEASSRSPWLPCFFFLGSGYRTTYRIYSWSYVCSYAYFYAVGAYAGCAAGNLLAYLFRFARALTVS